MTEAEVSYEQDSVEKGFPCYEVKLDSDNWMHLVHNTEEDELWISHVWTDKNGQFKQLMNQATAELGTSDIVFTMVVNDQLKKSLHGFEEDTIIHQKLDEEMTILRGEWE